MAPKSVCDRPHFFARPRRKTLPLGERSRFGLGSATIYAGEWRARSNLENQGGVRVSESILSSHALSVLARLCFKAATAGLTSSIPSLGRTTRIPAALVAGAGMNIGEGTSEHIPR